MKNLKLLLMISVFGVVIGTGYLLYNSYFREPFLNLYIENTSFELSKVNLIVSLDHDKVIDEVFEADSVAPNLRYYKMQLKRGLHTVKVEGPSIVVSDTFDLQKDSYLFITFHFKKKGKYEYEMEKFKFESLNSGQTSKRTFQYDSISVRPSIKLHLTIEEPKIE
jgi:hypothetical protein